MAVDNGQKSVQVLINRVFIAQIILVITATILIPVAAEQNLGSFWFAFLAGLFGASVALLRRARQGDSKFANQTLRSWSTTLAPFLYGGIMAAVAYFLFMSGILSGQDGKGILATNLFPNFGEPRINSGPLTVRDFLELRPKGVEDAGKLMVWCFLAGYSEGFVTGMLKRLERSTGGT